MRPRCASFVGVVGIELILLANAALGAVCIKASCQGASPHACRARIRGLASSVNLAAGARSRAARARAGAVLCASASASGVVWAYCGQSGASCGLLRVRGTGGEVGLPLAHLSAASVGRGRA